MIEYKRKEPPMNLQQYFESIKAEYELVRKLSDKNGSKSYVIRHRVFSRCLVLRLFSEPIAVYDLLKTVSFAYLPAVLDVIALDDGQAVLEEYIDGMSVAQVLEGGLYTYSGARKVLYCVCEAVEFLHFRGFVHRDIKPENVMISARGDVKLIDFNASRLYKDSALSDTVSLGTIGYASPEQMGIAQSGPGADIYALGVLLNVMLTGEHPSKRLAEGRAGKIVLKCTQINPEERYKTAFALKKDL